MRCTVRVTTVSASNKLSDMFASNSIKDAVLLYSNSVGGKITAHNFQRLKILGCDFATNGPVVRHLEARRGAIFSLPCCTASPFVLQHEKFNHLFA